MTIAIRPLDSWDALYLRYCDQTTAQPVVLRLDPIAREAWLESDRNIGGGLPIEFFNRRKLQWPVYGGVIPTAKAGTALLEELRSRFETIADGAQETWRGTHRICTYSPQAQEAIEEVDSALNREWRPSEMVEDWLAECWLDNSTAKDLGIKASSSDEKLMRIAGRLQKEASAQGPILIVGLLPHLKWMREQLKKGK